MVKSLFKKLTLTNLKAKNFEGEKSLVRFDFF